MLWVFLQDIPALGVKLKQQLPNFPFPGNFYKSSFTFLSTHCPSGGFLSLLDKAATLAGNFGGDPLFQHSNAVQELCPPHNDCANAVAVSSSVHIAEYLYLGSRNPVFSQPGLETAVLL